MTEPTPDVVTGTPPRRLRPSSRRPRPPRPGDPSSATPGDTASDAETPPAGAPAARKTATPAQDHDPAQDGHARARSATPRKTATTRKTATARPTTPRDDRAQGPRPHPAVRGGDARLAG